MAMQSKSGKGREFTAEEVATYNSPQRAYAAVHGTVLDVTAFAKAHPGGDLILLAAGRDATVLFETYHPRLQNGVPKSILDEYTVGTLKDDNSSYYDWKSGFYPTLKKRVVERLREKKLSRRGSFEITVKALGLLAGFWFSLYSMIVSDFYPNAILWSISMGAFASFVGTCIQHDGSHGAFSKNKFINKAAGWTLDMIGASAYTWELQHMLGHHPYTNLLDVKDCGDQVCQLRASVLINVRSPFAFQFI
jgi:predicted heme/steroid binding protein